MSYAICRDALVTQLRAVSGFNAQNVTAGDWRLLNQGHDRAVVVVYDSFEQEPSTFNRMVVRWLFQAHLLEKVQPDPAEVETRFGTDIAAILTRINSYRKLGNAAGVVDALALRGEDTGETVQIGSASYNHFGIFIQVEEEVDAAYAE